MPINPLVLELLEKAAESGLSAEEVCRDRPELLGEVRACLRQLSSVRDELDALFPEEGRPETPPSSARPEIPGYSVGEIIGRGGMGVVYKARHLRLNRPVAVKMMLNGGFAGPPELERFQHEAEALAALHHPNIVQVYDVGESGALPYFTMEFVDGGNLAQKQHGVPQSARDAAALMILLADAVEAAHRGGIVHRDLKPSNILMTSDGKPKITDFGLARRFEAGAGPSMTGTRIGTPGYMAPEQVAGHARVSGVATDVYALGAILYEMITGRPPFHAETPAATERQVIAEEPAPPARLNSRVPRDLETICLKCLQKEPRRRYSSAGELGEDIGRFLRNEPIKARPVCSVERAGKWMRRHPARAVSLFGGLTISAVMLVGGWWVFTERSLATHEIEEDLRIAKQALRRSDWGEARSALERARGRLGRGERGELRRRLDQAGRDYDLVRRLAAIRMDRISKTEAGAAHWPGEYEKAFRQAGLLDMDDAPQVAASKLGESDIKDALVAAIDDWALCDYVNDDRRGEAWLLEVARRSDPDPQGWRDRLRDPSVRRNQQELARLADSAEMDEAPVNLLISLGELMWRTEGDAVPFLHAIQRHHPNDIMANCLLGYDALKRKDMPEAIRSYQAALAIRPGTPFLYGALAVALARDGKSTEAISYYSEAVRLDPENEYLRTSFGDSLAAVGRVTEAAEQFERALQITRRDPWRLVVRKKLRACRSRLGDIDAVERAMAENSGSVAARRRSLGWIRRILPVSRPTGRVSNHLHRPAPTFRCDGRCPTRRADRPGMHPLAGIQRDIGTSNGPHRPSPCRQTAGIGMGSPLFPRRQRPGGIPSRQAGKRGLDHGWTREQRASGRTPPRLGHGPPPPGSGGGGTQDIRGSHPQERLEEVPGGCPREMDLSRAPPRGRGFDAARPPGVPERKIPASHQ